MTMSVPTDDKNRLLYILEDILAEKTFSLEQQQSITKFLDDVNNSAAYTSNYNWGLLLESVTNPNSSAVKEYLFNASLREIQLLTALGVDLESKDLRGNSVLMSKINAEQWDVAKFLITLKAGVNTANKKGDTPLSLALSEWNTEIVNLLLKAGATLEERNSNNDTLLLNAIKHKKWRSVKFLIDLGAKTDAKDNYGYTPRMLLAIVKDESDIEDLKENVIYMNDEERSHARTEYLKQEKLSKTIKESGHVLGYTSTIAGVNSAGINKKRGYSLLQKFLEKTDITFDDAIHQSLKLAIQNADPSSVNHQSLLRNHKDGKITILPVEWTGHGITLVAWNDVLIVSNRGGNKLEEAISVFMIPKDGIDEKFLNSIMPKNSTPSPEQVLNSITKLVGEESIRNPIAKFQSQDQKHGTCGFVNVKSSLQPIMCFIELLKDKQMDIKDFDSTFLQSCIADNTLDDAKREARNIYKAFTKEIRDEEITELCNEFKQLPPDSEEQEAYFFIFLGILKEHHGQGENKIKAQEERDRAEIILNTLSENGDFKKMFLGILKPELPANFVNNPQNFIWWVQQGLPVNMKNDMGHPAIIVAALSHQWDAVIQLAVLGGINNTTKEGITALMMAIQVSEVSTVKKLIDLGANLNDSMLAYAKIMNNQDIVKLLEDAMIPKIIPISNMKSTSPVEDNEQTLRQSIEPKSKSLTPAFLSNSAEKLMSNQPPLKPPQNQGAPPPRDAPKF
jgi:ankyrin repeat protein